MANKKKKKSDYLDVLGVLDPEIGMDPDDSQDVTDRIKESLPPQFDDCYAKVYILKPVSGSETKLVFLDAIHNLAQVHDLEVFLKEMAVERHWYSGHYVVYILRKDKDRGKSVLKEKIDLDIEVPDPDLTKVAEKEQSQEGGDFKRQVTDVLGFVKEVTSAVPSAPAVGNEVLKTQIEAFKQGVEAVKRQTPPDTGKTLLDTIGVLKQLGVIKESANGESSLTATLSLLQNLGVLKPTEQPKNPLDDLQKLTQVMNALKPPQPDVKPEDGISQIEKVTNMMTALQPFMQKGGDNTSPTVELIRAIGPQVGDIIGNITQSVNKIAEVAKIRKTPGVPTREMAAQMRYTPKPLENEVDQVSQTPEHALEQDRLIATEADSEDNQQMEDQEVFLSPVAKLLKVIEENDISYYEKLKEIISMYLGPQALEQLISGAVSVDTFLEQVASLLKNRALLSEKAKTYLRNFVDHCIDTSQVVTTKCERCGTLVDFDDEDLWKSSNKKCDNCDGQLVCETPESNATQNPVEV